MTFDLQKILESKEARRRYLAARPVAEKLRMLDAMRERELAIRGSSQAAKEGSTLPGGWERKTIGEMVEEMQYGTSAKTSEDASGVPVLRMGNIKDGSLVLGALKYLFAQGYPASTVGGRSRRNCRECRRLNNPPSATRLS